MTDQTQAAQAAVKPVYARMAVIGGGLIGSSVIRAARGRTARPAQIVVADANPEHRARLESLGIADGVFADPAEAARDADLIVLAVPVMAMGAATAAAAAGMKPGATLTDVGSVKGAVAEAMAAAAPEGVFVIPGHPVAGTEQSGPDAGFADPVREPLEHPDPAEARRRALPGGGRAAHRVLDAAGRAGRADGRGATTTWCWPSPPTCRT